jgi:5'-nucleotidase
MRILISNDDGVSAPGIHALAKEFSDCETVIVAPERERSTTGHALTLHKPLRMKRLERNVYWVSGGPADCIYLGIFELLKGKKPDLVLSGINRGANLGQDVFYSGTASAAREAVNLGFPAMAVSLDLSYHRKENQEHYATAAKAARKVLEKALETFSGRRSRNLKKSLSSWPAGMMLNVNVPNGPWSALQGIRPATQGHRLYSSKILKRKDVRGRDYYWIGGTYQGYRSIKNTDCWWVDRGYVAVTPLELDTTQKLIYERFRGSGNDPVLIVARFSAGLHFRAGKTLS